jgi:hypothetical protein
MKAEKTITDEIQELQAMPVPALVERYEAAFGKANAECALEFLLKTADVQTLVRLRAAESV